MTLMHCEGVSLVDGVELFLPRVLFDTGALCSSYVSSQWINQHIGVLQKYLLPVSSRVALADNVTIVPHL